MRSASRATVLLACVTAFGSLTTSALMGRPMQAKPAEVCPLHVSKRASHPFLRIAGIREVNGGIVYVVDVDDRSVWAVDVDRDRTQVLGRVGSGPGEYRMPSHIYALPADSSLVVDAAGGRTFIVTAEGQMVPDREHDEGRPITAGTLRGVDRHGNRYIQGERVRRGKNGAVELTDSVSIERVDRLSGKRDTLAIIATLPGSVARVIDGMVLSFPPSRAFAARDQWALVPDGSVVVAHFAPYAIDVFGVDGVRKAHFEWHVAAIPVSAEHRREWLESQRLRSIRSPLRDDRPVAWPRELPAFVDGALRVARDGTLWIQRTTEARGRPAFDLVDVQSGRRRRVVLSSGSRVVGFGDMTMYVTYVDSIGFEYLGRCPYPVA